MVSKRNAFAGLMALCVAVVSLVSLLHKEIYAQSSPPPSPAPSSSAAPMRPGPSPPGGEAKKDFDNWKPVFDIALGMVGLAGAILAFWKAQSEKRTQQSHPTQTDESLSIFRLTSSTPIPHAPAKRPYSKYLKLAAAGVVLILLSFISLMVVIVDYSIRADREDYLKSLESDIAHFEQREGGTEEWLTYLKDQKAQTEDQLDTSRAFRIGRYVAFSAAAVVFFLFGFLRLRTFWIWLLSRPRQADSPSKAWQRIDLSTSLDRAGAISRCLSAIKKTGAQVIEIEGAEPEKCSIRALKNYKGAGSHFEDIHFQIHGDDKISTIEIEVDGLRPTLRRDATRNQFILTALVNRVTSGSPPVADVETQPQKERPRLPRQH